MAQAQAHAEPRVAPPPNDAAVLCVLAGNEVLELPLIAVHEVLRLLPLTRMPHAPGFLLGLCNLRGAVLPVLSLRALRSLHGDGGDAVDHGACGAGEAAATGPGARIVVVTAAGSNRIGLQVEAVLPAGTPDAQRIAPGMLLPAAAAPPAWCGTGAPIGSQIGSPVGSGHGPEDVAERNAAKAAPVLLGFRVDGREFALPLDSVLSVAALPDTVSKQGPNTDANKVVGTDAAMLGVMASRDGLLPVLDAAVLLGLNRTKPSARLLLARINRCAAGLAVDAVTGILRPPADAIEPVPPLLLRGLGGESRIESICRLGHGNRLVQVLHPDRLLDEATAERLAVLDAEPSRKARAAPDTVAATAGREQVLLFGIGVERFALPVASVVEVVRHSGSLPRLPNAPGFIEGVLTLRGRAVPVVDGRRRFELPTGGSEKPQRVVVVSAGGAQLGLAVDLVSEVIWLAASALSPAPGFNGDGVFDRVATLDPEAMVLLVDPAALLRGVERDLRAASTVITAPMLPAGPVDPMLPAGPAGPTPAAGERTRA